MVTALTFIAAGVLGWTRAARRGGRTADKVQYALVHAIAATLAILALQILAFNMGWIG
ncbi:MAG: hypothetical protein AAGI34_02070 [Pseudomonadota bacterium]